jgi:hypothetical protein
VRDDGNEVSDAAFLDHYGCDTDTVQTTLRE